MVYTFMLVFLLALLFSWILYFYGTEERVERLSELREGNVVIRAIDTGVILGMCIVGLISIVLILM